MKKNPNKKTLILPAVNEIDMCPCCFKGKINEQRMCERCFVTVPTTAVYDNPWTVRPRRFSARQDQDRLNPMVELVRYKEDHE